jgi:hypothetical protein
MGPKVKSKVRKNSGRRTGGDPAGAAAGPDGPPTGPGLCCVSAGVAPSPPSPPGCGVVCPDRTILDPEETVRVSCTDQQCPASGLLHARCFEKFENKACLALSTTPRANSWTDGQVMTVI